MNLTLNPFDRLTASINEHKAVVYGKLAGVITILFVCFVTFLSLS